MAARETDTLPPIPADPMLARLVRELPEGAFLYEPKWDGFRCLALRASARVELRSRRDRPLARYFPEIVEALRDLPTGPVALDGEIIVTGPHGPDFEALLARLHPAASRVALLREGTPATYVAFDLLWEGREDLRQAPFEERRRRLEGIVGAASDALHITETTEDPEVARGWLERSARGGIDGVVAKERSGTYRHGARAMIKVKLERTADCVVAGYRLGLDEPLIASLLLGMYDQDDVLRHVGVASQFRKAQRSELLERLRPHEVPLEHHPWREGFLLGGGAVGRLPGSAARWTPDMAHDWAPVSPELVCEVAYDQVDRGRFRFPARLRRWRPDRDPASCRLSQLGEPDRGPERRTG